MSLICRFSPHFLLLGWILVPGFSTIVRGWLAQRSFEDSVPKTTTRRHQNGTEFPPFRTFGWLENLQNLLELISETISGYRKWEDNILLYFTRVPYCSPVHEWLTDARVRKMTTQLSANEATKNLGERGKQQMTASADKQSDDMTRHDGKTGTVLYDGYPMAAPQQEHGQTEKMRNKTSDETTDSDMKQMTWKMKTDDKWRGKQLWRAAGTLDILK